MEKFQLSHHHHLSPALDVGSFYGPAVCGPKLYGNRGTQRLYRHPKHYFAQLGAAYRKNAA